MKPAVLNLDVMAQAACAEQSGANLRQCYASQPALEVKVEVNDGMLRPDRAAAVRVLDNRLRQAVSLDAEPMMDLSPATMPRH